MKAMLTTIMMTGLMALGVAQAADNDIVLGQSAPLTGSFGELGTAYRDGAQLYFDEINRKGGINGRHIRLKTLDDAYVAKKAEDNTRKLIEEHKALALFGYMFTNTVNASLPIATEAKVPFIAPYAGYDGLFQKLNPMLFLTFASFSNEFDMLVRQVQTMGLKRVVLIRYDSASGIALQNEFDVKMKAINVNPLGSAVMKVTSREVTEVVAKLIRLRPAAIILGISGGDAVEFIRQFNKAEEVKSVQYLARSLIGAHQLVTELKKESRGIVMTQLTPSPFHGTTSVAREYQKALKVAKEMGKKTDADYYGFAGFIAAKVMVEGLRRAGPKLSRAALIAGFETMSKWDAGDYPIDFGPTDHIGSKFVSLTVIGVGGHVVE